MSKIQDLCDFEDCFGKLSVRRFIYPEKSFILPVELRAAGLHYISSHDYSWDGAQRFCKESGALIQYTLTGSGALDWNGKVTTISPGDAMLLTFPEQHRYFLPPESDHWEVLYISFTGSGAQKIIRDLRSGTDAVVSLSPTGKTVSTMRSILHSDQPPTVWGAADRGYHLLMALADELSQQRCGTPLFLQKVMNYCRNHLNEDLSVDGLAEISGYSRWYFSREFKKNLGLSVPQYVMELRLQQAEELLQSTQYSVKEIAEMCGFRNTAYFIRCFSEMFGVTPSIFRKTEK